jgi:hypothetical protein
MFGQRAVERQGQQLWSAVKRRESEPWQRRRFAGAQAAASTAAQGNSVRAQALGAIRVIPFWVMSKLVLATQWCEHQTYSHARLFCRIMTPCVSET